MNQKLWTKLLATMLVMTLTLTNFMLLGVYAGKAYGASDNLEKQQTVTNNENVTFDAYFKDNKGNAIHSIKENQNREDLKLFVAVEVKKGYLKNASLQVLGENKTNSNLKLKNSNEDLEYIETIEEQTNTIHLKQINSGTQVVLEIPVQSDKSDQYDITNFSKLNDIVLTGTYMGDAGTESKIQKTIQTRNEWLGEASVTLEQQLLRFIPYEVNRKKGTILQTLVKNGIQNNTLPVEENNLVIETPVVNGKRPTDVTVVANGILATNGKESLNKENWSYNKETGIVTITVKNEVVDGKISWLKQRQDEFVITYLYEDKVDTLETLVKASANVKAYNTIETNIQKSHELTISQNEVLGQIVASNVEVTENISKGYLYTNTPRETSYFENVTVDVSYPELVDNFTINQPMDYFVNEVGEVSPTTIGNTNYAYYKTTKISKENFVKILGEEGTLQIVTLEGEELITLNKDTQVDENGDYVFAYEKQTNQIRIIGSKPVQSGKLVIRHEKALKGNTDYSKAQVESFKTLNAKVQVEAKVEAQNKQEATPNTPNTIAENEQTAQELVVSNVETTKDITLIAPTTKIEASVSNANLSTVVTNENVELRVVLKTSDITCDLYKNPVIEMVLPSYIEKVEVKDVNLLFDNELTVKDYNTFVNENGNTVIRVNIEGEQTTYSGDEITKGANLIINTNIILKQLTPTTDDVMKVYVTNELATAYEQTEAQRARKVMQKSENTSGQKGYQQVALKAVAPVGMVTTNTISGFNAKNETITSMSSKEQIGKLDVKQEAKTATLRMNVINNYQNTVNQVSILGRIPTKGSKNADTLEDFGSNLAITMANVINVSGVDASLIEIYYTPKEDATKDLTLASNGWTKTPDNIANVKSYLIVVKGDVVTGTNLDISYQITIPENLKYNVQAYSNYVVYFNNVTKERTISEKAVATRVGLETGDGPELEVTIHSDQEGQEVKEGQIITYTIQVKNVGKSEVKNVTVSGNIPKKTVYTYVMGEGDEGTERIYDNQVESYSQVIESLPSGETKTFIYEVKTTDLHVGYDEDGSMIVEDCTMQNTAKATVQGNDIEFTSNTLENKLIQGYVNIDMKVEVIPEYYTRAEGDEITYAIYVENVNLLVKKNLKVKTTLPEGVSYIGALPKAQYDEKSREITWDIDTLKENEIKRIQFGVTVDSLNANIYEKTIKTKATIIGEQQIESNETSIMVQKASLTIKQTTDTKVTVSESDTITYNFEIQNTGMGDAADIEVVDELPEELKYDSVQYSYNGKTYEAKLGSANTAKIRIAGLKAGQTLSIAIKAVVQSLDKGVKQKEITNTASVKADGINTLISNEIKHTIVAKQGSDINDPSTDDNVEGTYRISGIAWLDQNKDGKRDEGEQKLAGIPVILLHAENGNIVKDIVTGKDKKQETNEYGEYAFSNLNPGNYMVIFLYDSGKYATTNYKQAGVNDNQNSDAVQVKVVYEGVTRVAGASDTLSVTSENRTNIDIGLVLSPKFDLKLDKVISRITVSDAKGTDVYDYKDEKVAKLDLNKKMAVGSSIMIEYKIKVTNEGAVPGYAKKIVDYMPSDMKFSSELNKDWYVANNGTNLYNASLANTLINPGETKEVTLLLTKKITESNMGIVNNTAEIVECSNDLGIADNDSTPGNKVQNEDDMSSADVIIGTKTGEVYMYMVLALIVVGMLGTGIFLIKKKVIGSK